MFFLLALSILSITVIIYKARDLRRRFVLPEDAVNAIENSPTSLGSGDASALISQLRTSPSTLGRLGLIALAGDHADKDDASRAVEARAREEVVVLEAGVALLEVVITIAPLLGLLGTVSGLVNVFSNLGDTADNSAIAKGIAEALNTTIAGLAIAVPTVVAHSFFMKKIERMGVRLEILLGGLIASIYRAGGSPITEDAVEEVYEAPPVEPEYQPEASPEIYTAMPDPGEAIYESSYPETEADPAPVDPGFPRLLAGHQAPETDSEITPVDYDSDEPEVNPS